MLSIITPVLNGETFIEANIKAIKDLSIPFEHIIVDGGSADDTLAIISGYPHLKLVIQNGKNGMYSAINQGVKVAQGDYITYINCDDLIDTEYFSEMFQTLKLTSADFIYSDGYLKYSSNSKKKYYKSARLLFRYFLKKGIMPFNQPCSIYRKKLYETIGGFNEDDFRYCGDIDFFRRIIEIDNISIKYFSKPTVTFLIHDDSLTTKYGDVFYDEYRKNSIPVPSLPDRLLYFVSRKLRL